MNGHEARVEHLSSGWLRWRAVCTCSARWYASGKAVAQRRVDAHLAHVAGASDPALPKYGRSKMPPISPERAREARAYAVLRPGFLAEHPLCESPWPCGQRATTIQHRMGRRGWRFLAVQWWAGSCLACNLRAEQTDTADAYRTHWKVSPDFTGWPEDVPILPIDAAPVRPQQVIR